MLPWAETHGPQQLRWELRRRAGSVELWAIDEAERESLRLLAWAGNKGAWSYLDDDGKWRDTWPPAPQPGSLKDLGLPRAVRLQTGLDGLLILLEVALKGM
jgi:hypothetical protein